MKNKLLLSIILLCILFSCSKKVYLSPSDNIISIIHQTEKPTTYFLTSGEYLDYKTIVIPKNVNIIGKSNVVFKREKINDNSPQFLFKGSNSSIKNIKIKLYSKSRGIATDSLLRKISIENINIEGNLLNKNIKENHESTTAITGNNLDEILIKNCSISNTFGGIYLSNINNSKIISNTLEKVNFGNIVINTSENTSIVDNKIIQPGKGSKNHHPSGDGITVGGKNKNININNNVFKNGYCYLIWITGSIDKSTISNNLFDSSVTTSLAIDNANEVIINDNVFKYSYASGIILNKNYNNIEIKNNIFFNDCVISRNPEAKNITVENNKFYSNYLTDDCKGINGQVTKQSKNQVFYNDDAQLPEMVIRDSSDQKIYNQQVFNTKLLKNTFSIEINGERGLNLSGFPQVILSDSIISKNQRGNRKSGDTYSDGFKIYSDNNLNDLYLSPSEEPIRFTVEIDTTNLKNNSVYLNIPTSIEKYNPFWIKVNYIKD